MPRKSQKVEKADAVPRVGRKLPDAREEMFCQLLACGDPIGESYRIAFDRMGDAKNTIAVASFRLKQKPYIPGRIQVIKNRVASQRIKLAKAKTVICLREDVVARAEIGWQMAMEANDLGNMSKHNRDMADFIRDSYWNNTAEVHVDGHIDQLLREVSSTGPEPPTGYTVIEAVEEQGTPAQLALQGEERERSACPVSDAEGTA